MGAAAVLAGVVALLFVAIAVVDREITWFGFAGLALVLALMARGLG